MTKNDNMELMLRRMIVLLLIFLPLFFIPQAYNKYELSKVLLFRAYIDLIFIILIFKILSQKRPIVKSPLSSPAIMPLGGGISGASAGFVGKVGVGVGLFLGVSYLASVLGVDFGQSILGTYFRNQGMITLLHYGMFFVILSSFEKEDFEAIFNGLLGGALLVSVLVFLQFLIHVVFGVPVELFNDRYHLTFGNPNFMGAYLAICLPIGVWRALKQKKIWAGVILMIVGIVLSGSRGAVLGAAAGVLGLGYLRSLSFLSKGVVVMVIMATFFYMNSRGSLYEDRFTIWEAGIRAFAQRPVLGWGLENFEYAYKAGVSKPWLLNVKVDRAHNEIIEVLTASGVVGILAYLFLLWVIFKNLNGLGRAVLVSFMALSLTNVLSITAYVVFWVLASMAAVYEEKRKEFEVGKAVLLLMIVICLYLLLFNIENVGRDIMLRNALGNIFTFISAA